MSAGTWVQAVGSLAGAWGAYEVGKEQNKIAEDKLAYEKGKDALTLAKTNQAQAELDGAMSSVYGSSKKKAKSTDGSLSDAFTEITPVTT